MLSNFFFFLGTLLLSLNFIRFFGLAISDWIFFIALSVMIIETITIDKKNINQWIKNPFIISAWLILFGGVISTYYSNVIPAAVVEIIQQLYISTFFISMLGIIVNRGKSKWIINAFIASGIITALITIVDFTTGTRIGPMLSEAPNQELWYRYAGTLRHPNKLGYFLVLTSILSLSNWSGKKTLLHRLFWVILTIIQVFGIYLSGSVTAFLGLMSGILVMFIATNQIQKKIPFFLIFFLLIILIFVFLGEVIGIKFFQLSEYTEGIIFRSFSRVKNETALSRLDNYIQAIDNIVKSPFVGTGFDQTSTSSIDVSSRQLDNAVHNALLQTWYFGGFFTFLGYLIIYIKIGAFSISTLWNYKKRNLSTLLPGLASAALAILIMDQFQDAIYQREKWLVFGLLMGSLIQIKTANKVKLKKPD